MPTLPLQRVQAGPAQLGRRATPEDAGAGAAAARGQRAGLFGALGGAVEQVIEVRSRVREGANQARLARAAAEYSAARRRSVLDAENDTELDTLEERFGAQGEQLLEQHRKALPQELQRDFEDRVFASEAAARLDVAQSVTRRQTATARANADEALRLASDEAAAATDPVRRAQVTGQAVATLEGLLSAGILDQAGFDDRRRKLERGIGDADRLRTPPGVLYRELADASSPLAAGLSEVERLQERARALERFEEDLRERRAALSFAQAQEDRAERDADDAADQRALDLLSANDLPGLQQFLAQTRGVLSVARREFYLKRIERGGGLSDEGDGTNPGAYADLSNRAAAGDLRRDEIDEAFRGGLISRADRDRLVQDASDRRFSGGEKLLGDSLQQSPFRFDTKTQVRNAEAKRAFAEFKATHPEASETEALEYARQLIRYTGLQDLASNPPPLFGAQGVGAGPFDAAAATAAALAANEAGQITDDELDAELQRIDAMEDAQKRAGAPK